MTNMAIILPKNALQRVQMGQSFAEYDLVRNDPSIFVATPASLAATQEENGKCFFVGRRGAGKTAIAYHIQSHNRRAVSLNPQIFDLLHLPLKNEDFRDTRQRAFKSLVCAFERALLGELIKSWLKARIWKFDDQSPHLSKDRGLIEGCDFDDRVLNVVQEIFEAYNNPNERLWLRQINRAKEIVVEVNGLRQNANFDYVFLIDRLDESWDGSESAIICLMALMHCCVRLSASCTSVRPILFLRENIYTRIRNTDNEFSRLETSIVFLEWTQEKLAEFVERRLVRRFSTKPALGEAWSYFFDDTESFSSKKEIFKYCQDRPRDVLAYVSYALESAVSHNRRKIGSEDVINACERFSTNKLKDLADEFAENYPNIQLVLELFYGLATEYTLAAIENFIEKLIIDKNTTRYCKDWIFEAASAQKFVSLFFGIGFLGIKDGKNWVFKTTSGDAAFMPSILAATTVRIHPAYHAALHLREVLLPAISNETILKVSGILQELPGNISFDGYHNALQGLLDRIDYIAHGKEGASEFEDWVGEVITLCFFRSLTNVQPKVRDLMGVVVRDWIASNRAVAGFWEMVRIKYHATQIIWECKNYKKLKADDFHQASYYINDVGGKFVVIAYRGEHETSYFRHIQKIAHERQGIVLLLTEKDLRVFIRQALHGRGREDHINQLYDTMVRSLA